MEPINFCTRNDSPNKSLNKSDQIMKLNHKHDCVQSPLRQDISLSHDKLQLHIVEKEQQHKKIKRQEEYHHLNLEHQRLFQEYIKYHQKDMIKKVVKPIEQPKPLYYPSFNEQQTCQNNQNKQHVYYGNDNKQLNDFKYKFLHFGQNQPPSQYHQIFNQQHTYNNYLYSQTNCNYNYNIPNIDYMQQYHRQRTYFYNEQQNQIDDQLRSRATVSNPLDLTNLQRPISGSSGEFQSQSQMSGVNSYSPSSNFRATALPVHTLPIFTLPIHTQRIGEQQTIRPIVSISPEDTNSDQRPISVSSLESSPHIETVSPRINEQQTIVSISPEGTNSQRSTSVLSGELSSESSGVYSETPSVIDTIPVPSVFSVPIPNQRTQCPYCTRDFTRHCYLVQHINTAHANLPVVCTICGKRFTTQKTMKIHKERHNSKKRYLCSQCPKQFHYRSDLKRHAIQHTEIKPHICNVCDKGFSRKDHMKKHMQVHRKNEKFDQIYQKLY